MCGMTPWAFQVLTPPVLGGAGPLPLWQLLQWEGHCPWKEIRLDGGAPGLIPELLSIHPA